MLSVKYILASLQNKKNEGLSRSDLLLLQQKQFKKLVRYAYSNSSYYNKIIRENNISLDSPELSRFPILTKEAIYENFDSIVTDPKITRKKIEEYLASHQPNNFLNKYNVTKTSGTSGTPGYCIQTDEEVIRGISTAMRGKGEGAFKTRIAMIGFSREHASSTMTMNFSSKFLVSKLLLDYKLIDIEQPASEIANQLNDFKPSVLCGYSKVLVFLADLKGSGVLKINPHTLQSGGEQLFDSDRKYIEGVFNAPVNNQYGSTEHLVMGVGKSSWNGMYLSEDRLIFELLAEDTLITNLFNFTLPMIRYRSKDVLEKTSRNPANFPFLFIEDQVGRADEIPVFYSTKNNQLRIHPICFDRLMPDEIKSFQLLNIAENDIVFNVVLKDPEIKFNTDEIEKRIANFISEKDLNHVCFRVAVVSDLQKNIKSHKTSFWNVRGETQ